MFAGMHGHSARAARSMLLPHVLLLLPLLLMLLLLVVQQVP